MSPIRVLVEILKRTENGQRSDLSGQGYHAARISPEVYQELKRHVRAFEHKRVDKLLAKFNAAKVTP